ncbi:hypothetical protein [Mycoplasmopsis gallinarum]|uniref:Uncharacterized protein n=1 Tax=Mycoplasmopsis gallinarum TaxID=29557 RepID=A0A168RR99_9BACT|nr:hypothetical protein [Mycoplasmopsis gallinarum]OAB49210.1 hypothetical protein MGALLINA_00280 [Mycoplasmopsis gallinarum]
MKRYFNFFFIILFICFLIFPILIIYRIDPTLETAAPYIVPEIVENFWLINTKANIGFKICSALVFALLLVEIIISSFLVLSKSKITSISKLIWFVLNIVTSFFILILIIDNTIAMNKLWINLLLVINIFWFWFNLPNLKIKSKYIKLIALMTLILIFVISLLPSIVEITKWNSQTQRLDFLYYSIYSSKNFILIPNLILIFLFATSIVLVSLNLKFKIKTLNIFIFILNIFTFIFALWATIWVNSYLVYSNNIFLNIINNFALIISVAYLSNQLVNKFKY